MRLLLDTHILLGWIEQGTAGLPRHIAACLEGADSEHHLSTASLWEIAIKWRLGKLTLTPPLEALPELLEGLGIQILAINAQHALASVDLEPRARDPFDRMLLAQCQIEGLKLMTLDRALLDHPLALKG